MPTTSYSNFGGSGNRTALIDTSYSGITGGCVPGSTDLKALIDGSFATGSCTTSFAWGNTNTAAALIFDFRAGNSMIIDEFKWSQSDSSSHGTWNFAGSNDGTTWTDLLTGLTLGGSTVNTYSVSNTVGHRYYKLYQTGGTTSNNPWLEEIEFKIVEASGGNYNDALSKGNRTSLITTSSSGLTGGCNSPNFASELIDGSFVNGCSTASAWGNTNTAGVLKFDLGTAKIITEFLWYQDIDATHGTWAFAGSNDDITYTDVATGLTLGVTNGYGQAVFSFSNSTAYRYYKLHQTGGTTSANPWNREIEFKIGGAGNVWASTEAQDTFSAVGYPGTFGKVGDWESTEAPDAFAASGFVAAVGVLLGFEAPDQFSAFVTQPKMATWASTEAPDHFAATGIGRGEDGTWGSTEAPDVFAATGTTPIAGTWASTEAKDTFRAVGPSVSKTKKRRIFFVT